jgi:hypothetical protein
MEAAAASPLVARSIQGGKPRLTQTDQVAVAQDPKIPPVQKISRPTVQTFGKPAPNIFAGRG